MNLHFLAPFLILAATVHAAEDNDKLSRQATDPTASLMALNFQSIYTGAFHGTGIPGEEDEQWLFQFRPVIPFEFLDRPNIFRATIPYQTGGRGDEGFAPLSFFNLMVFNQDWGRWGLGPMMSIDTTGDLPDGFSVGPAAGFVWQIDKKLNLGLFTQNVFWSDTALTNIQPVIAYQLGGGWSLSAGDLQFSYDWEHSRWLSIPVGIQLGKVAKLGDQPVRIAINPQYNFQNDRGLGEWSVSSTFTTLFPAF